MSQDLKDLLARVEGAAEGSQELDEAIHAVLRANDEWWKCIVEGRMLVSAGDPDAYVVHPSSGSRMRAESWALSSKVPRHSTSIDAAFQLIEDVLPGWRIYLEEANSEAERWWCGLCRPGPRSGAFGHESAYAPSAALAPVSALLRTLLAQTETSDAR